MSPNDSKRWTGASDPTTRRTGLFLRRLGDPQYATAYHRFAEIDRERTAMKPELTGVVMLALLLIVSPLVLWTAWGLMRALTGDFLVRDNGVYLSGWGGAMVALSIWQIRSRSLRWIPLRKAALVAGIIGTFGLGGAYVYGGVRAHDAAIATAPERTYQLCRSRGRSPFRMTTCHHQRADGSTLEGRRAVVPVAYGSVCALAQRLDGPNGFSWVRVLERSRAPDRGQLTWPIRREQCFSTTPLSKLPA